MTSGVDGNSFDRFFKITVQAWDPSGNGENDCLSRIAQTSMKNAGNADAGSWAAIEAKQKEIQEYNNKYNDEKIENADIVHEGQEVLIPLEDAIEGIRNEFETVTGEYNEAQQTIEDKTGELTSANEGVSTAFDALQTAQQQYNAVKDGDDESAKSSKLSALESAKKEYRKALEEQQKAQEELEKAQTDAEEIQDKMDELEGSLEEYTDRKEQKEDEIDQQLKEIAGNIEGLEEDLSKAQDELDKMKQELITMQEGSEAANGGAETGAKGWNQIGDEAKEALETSKNSKDNAALLGFYDEEGNLISEEDAANQDIDYDLLERGEVTGSKIIDGNRVKKYEFEDGSSAEFHKDDNGDFTKRGTRYNADGTITYPDGSVHNPETGETTPADEAGSQTGDTSGDDTSLTGDEAELNATTYEDVMSKENLLAGIDEDSDIYKYVSSQLDSPEYKPDISVTNGEETRLYSSEVLANAQQLLDFVNDYKADMAHAENYEVYNSDTGKYEQSEAMKAYAEENKEFDPAELVNQDYNTRIASLNSDLPLYPSSVGSDSGENNYEVETASYNNKAAEIQEAYDAIEKFKDYYSKIDSLSTEDLKQARELSGNHLYDPRSILEDTYMPSISDVNFALYESDPEQFIRNIEDMQYQIDLLTDLGILK